MTRKRNYGPLPKTNRFGESTTGLDPVEWIIIIVLVALAVVAVVRIVG